MKKTIFAACALGVMLVILLGLPADHVSAANSITAKDLITMVNDLRINNGLSALSENDILDGTAQATAQQMADQNLTDHIGNIGDRIMAAGYGDGRTVTAIEDLYFNSQETTLAVIQAFWADAAHMVPMTDSKYTDIGAGVATSSTGVVYYVVHAAYVSGGTPTPTPNPTDAASASGGPTSAIVPVITSTPHSDGSVIHIVQRGQACSIISVAYNTTCAILGSVNNLDAKYDVYIGEALLMPSPTLTITPTVTATFPTPTRTITPTRMPATITPTMMPSPTPTVVTVAVGGMHISRRTLGMIIIAICALGLGFVMFISLRKK
jgi:LysM repeat protein